MSGTSDADVVEAARPHPTPADPVTRRRRADLVLQAAAVAAVVTPIVVALLVARGRSWYPSADNAQIELQTLDVPSHLPLFGAYSREGFHHPGPAELLLLAAPLRLFGPFGLLLGTGLINAVAVGGTVLVLFRRGGRGLLAGGVATMLVVEHAFAGQLLDPWNTWVPVLPFALALVLAWSVVCREWWALPVLGAVLSFVVQAHVGYALLAVWLLGGVLLFAVVDRVRSTRPGRRSCPAVVLVTLGAVLVAAWLLPVYGQVRESPGNLGLIVDHFAHSSEAPVGWGSSLGLVAQQVGSGAPWLGGTEALVPFSGAAAVASPWTLLPVVAVFAVTLALVLGTASRRGARAAREAAWFQVVVGSSAVVGFVSVARITGEPFPYLLHWLWVIGALLWLSSAWSAWITWAWRADREPAAPAADPWSPRPLLAVVAVALGGLCAWSSSAAAASPVPAPTTADAVGALAGPTEAALRDRGPVLVTADGPALLEVRNGLLAELDRRGIPVRVEDDEAFRYGTHRTIGASPAAATFVVASRGAVNARLARGEVPIALYDPLTASEHAELDSIDGRYAAQIDAQRTGRLVPDPLSAADVRRSAELHAAGDLVAVFPGPAPPSG